MIRVGADRIQGVDKTRYPKKNSLRCKSLLYIDFETGTRRLSEDRALQSVLIQYSMVYENTWQTYQVHDWHYFVVKIAKSVSELAPLLHIFEAPISDFEPETNVLTGIFRNFLCTSRKKIPRENLKKSDWQFLLLFSNHRIR